MADILIDVDSSQVVSAKTEMGTLSKGFTNAANSAVVFMQAFDKAFAKGIAEADRAASYIRKIAKANQEIINTNLGVSNSYKPASESAKTFIKMLDDQAAAEKRLATSKADTAFALGAQKAKEEAAAINELNRSKQQQAAAEEQLRLKYDESYRMMQVYKAELVSLDAALKAGVLTQDQYKLKAEELSNALTKGSGMFKNYTNESMAGMNNAGVLIQQLGYQAGDFIVQVQSGTNAFVAFGQQATQMVGFLPLLAREAGVASVAFMGMNVAIAPLTLGLSIIIPLVTAVGAAWMRTSQDAKESSEKVDDFTKSIEDLSDLIKSNELLFSKMRFGVDEAALANAYANIDKFQLKILEASELNLQWLKSMNIGGGEAYSAAIAAQKQFIDDLKDKIAKEQKGIDIVREQQGVLRGLTAAEEASKLQNQIKLGLLAKQVGAQQDAADKANYLKSVFHALAGEAGAVSVNVGEWAGDINDAITALDRYNAKGALNANMVGRGLPEGYGQGIVGGISTSPVPQGRPIDLAENAAEAAAAAAKKHGRGGAGNSKLESLINELQTQQETIDEWYKNSKASLEKASADELEILGGKYQAMARLDEEYRKKIYDAQQAQAQMSFQAYSGMFSALGDLLGMFGEKSKGAAIAALIIQKGLAIAQIVTSTAAAQMRAYAELGPIAGAGMAAKIGILGKVQMGLVAATGIAQAGQIMSSSGTSSGGSSGNGVGSAHVPATSATTAAPTTVMIQGLKPTDIFTGEQLSDLFDNLYKENTNRGMVFMVQR